MSAAGSYLGDSDVLSYCKSTGQKPFGLARLLLWEYVDKIRDESCSHRRELRSKGTYSIHSGNPVVFQSKQTVQNRGGNHTTYYYKGAYSEPNN